MAEASAYVAATTGDGRLVYLSAKASPPQPGLEQALTSLLYELAKRKYSELLGDRVRVDALRALRAMGFKVDDVLIAVSYRCPQCGASIQLTPEIVVYVCPYCGWAGSVFGEEVSLLAWPAGRREDLRGLVERSGCELVSAELRYVPFWVFEAHVDAEYVALVTYQETRVVPGGPFDREGSHRVRVETRRTRVSGRVVFDSVKALPARFAVEIYGGEQLRTWVQSMWYYGPPQRLSAEEAKLFAPSILAPELSERVARARAEDELEDDAAAEAKRSAERQVRGSVVSVQLLRFRPSVSFKRASLVFAPYWIFTYSRGGALYTGSAVGPELSKLKLELPLSNVERAARLLGSLLAVFGAGLVAELTFRATSGVLLPLFVAGVGLIAAVKLATSAYAPARVG
ncbi:MAG: hypothetical protein QXE91_06235 [Thermofilaceae archaeon]